MLSRKKPMEKIMAEENLRQAIDQFWETVPMV
jgi:hypothetical protein